MKKIESIMFIAVLPQRKNGNFLRRVSFKYRLGIRYFTIRSCQIVKRLPCLSKEEEMALKQKPWLAPNIL